MNVTEYDKKLDWKHIQEEMSEMRKEFEVLGNAYKMQESALEKLQAESETQSGLIQRLKNDLQLKKHHSYRNKTTRQLAQEAFNQSTVKANWEGLGKHPVIESIYEDIKNRSTDEGRRADDIIRRFENMPDWQEIMKEIGEHSEIKNLWSRVKDSDSDIAELKDVQKVDRHNIYAKFGTQRDKNSDIETALEALEFLGSEREIKYDTAFMFLMGAWAQSGYEPVANGLREILKKPKVVNDDGSKTEQTEKPSQ